MKAIMEIGKYDTSKRFVEGCFIDRVGNKISPVVVMEIADDVAFEECLSLKEKGVTKVEIETSNKNKIVKLKKIGISAKSVTEDTIEIPKEKLEALISKIENLQEEITKSTIIEETSTDIDDVPFLATIERIKQKQEREVDPKFQHELKKDKEKAMLDRCADLLCGGK